MTAKEELRKLVDELDDIDAAEVLAHVRWLPSDGEALSEETLEAVKGGEEDVSRGEYVTLEALKRPIVA
jgi:hypothetical protein